VRREGDALAVGAMTPHVAVAESSEVVQIVPALAALAGSIGDPLVRNRGTIAGSIANADPAADYPAALLGLGAVIVTERREIAADDFFLGLFDTALEPGEIIRSVRFPIPQAACYLKLPQPASRFALVGVFVARGRNGEVRVAVTGAGPSVFRFRAAEAELGKRFEPSAVESVALPAAGLNADIHASAEYRANAVQVMTRRAVAAALAGQGGGVL
jgi:carbon-monoxide dehydrogenase medium subunit